MKKFGLPILAMVLALALSACSDSDSPSGGSSSGSITANSVSGAGVTLSGTWTLCYDNAGSDTMEIQVFSGTTLTISESTWTSADGSCTITEIADPSPIEVTNLANDIDVTMLGWSDRNTTSFVTTPTAADGTTIISDTPIYSGVSGTFSGSTAYLVFFVDDTGSSQLLYRAVNLPTSLCGAIGNYTDTCAFTGDLLTKQ